MCGIFGYIGPDNSAVICLEGLKKLEYRGYDSAGLVGISEGRFHFWKEIGKRLGLWLIAIIGKYTQRRILSINLFG